MILWGNVTIDEITILWGNVTVDKTMILWGNVTIDETMILWGNVTIDEAMILWGNVTIDETMILSIFVTDCNGVLIFCNNFLTRQCLAYCVNIFSGPMIQLSSAQDRTWTWSLDQMARGSQQLFVRYASAWLGRRASLHERNIRWSSLNMAVREPLSSLSCEIYYVKCLIWRKWNQENLFLLCKSGNGRNLTNKY